MITIESLEAALDLLLSANKDLNALVKFKEIRSPKKVRESIKMFLPRFEVDSRRLIDDATEYTEVYGHSPRLDYIKDKAFEMLGRCVAEPEI